jgi:hypothetical protein
MVHLDPSPLGHLLYEADRQQALAEFQRAGRLDGLSDQAIQEALGCLSRDERLREASRRWVPGGPTRTSSFPVTLQPFGSAPASQC